MVLCRLECVGVRGQGAVIGRISGFQGRVSHARRSLEVKGKSARLQRIHEARTRGGMGIRWVHRVKGGGLMTDRVGTVMALALVVVTGSTQVGRGPGW